jgi:hypothetical protein
MLRCGFSCVIALLSNVVQFQEIMNGSASTNSPSIKAPMSMASPYRSNTVKKLFFQESPPKPSSFRKFISSGISKAATQQSSLNSTSIATIEEESSASGSAGFGRQDTEEDRLIASFNSCATRSEQGITEMVNLKTRNITPNSTSTTATASAIHLLSATDTTANAATATIG